VWGPLGAIFGGVGDEIEEFAYDATRWPTTSINWEASAS
jgi:hypothetical protein